MCKLRSQFCVLCGCDYVAVAGTSWRLMEIHHYQRRSRLHDAFNEFSSDVQFNSLAALFPGTSQKVQIPLAYISEACPARLCLCLRLRL